jgi:hypothetical protein
MSIQFGHKTGRDSFCRDEDSNPNASVQVNLSRKLEFPVAPLDFQKSLLLNRLSYMGLFILAAKLSKLSTTFM